MKILVDNLPYDKSSCPFPENYLCRMDKDGCPTYTANDRSFVEDVLDDKFRSINYE